MKRAYCKTKASRNRQGPRLGFRFRDLLAWIRRPTRAFCELKYGPVYVECGHRLVQPRESLHEDADEEGDEGRIWWRPIFTRLQGPAPMNPSPNPDAHPLRVNTKIASITMFGLSLLYVKEDAAPVCRTPLGMKLSTIQPGLMDGAA